MLTQSFFLQQRKRALLRRNIRWHNGLHYVNGFAIRVNNSSFSKKFFFQNKQMKEDYQQDSRIIRMKEFWKKNAEKLNQSLTNSFKIGKLEFKDWLGHCKTLFFLFINACNYLGWRRDTPEVEIVKHYVPELMVVMNRLKGLKVSNRVTDRKYVIGWPDWHGWRREQTEKHFAKMQVIQDLQGDSYIKMEENHGNREAYWGETWRMVDTPDTDESEETYESYESEDDSDSTDVITTSIQY